MEVKPRIIRDYITQDGHNLYREWLHSLRDTRARAKVRVRVNRVRQGNFGDSKSLGGGLLELRIHYGPGYRLYLGELHKVVVILLCGGDKRSQKQDIKKAKEYWQEFKSRNYE